MTRKFLDKGAEEAGKQTVDFVSDNVQPLIDEGKAEIDDAKQQALAEIEDAKAQVKAAKERAQEAIDEKKKQAQDELNAEKAKAQAEFEAAEGVSPALVWSELKLMSK